MNMHKDGISITDLFNEYMKVTQDPGAAATLALAFVIAETFNAEVDDDE